MKKPIKVFLLLSAFFAIILVTHPRDKKEEKDTDAFSTCYSDYTTESEREAIRMAFTEVKVLEALKWREIIENSLKELYPLIDAGENMFSQWEKALASSYFTDESILGLFEVLPKYPKYVELESTLKDSRNILENLQMLQVLADKNARETTQLIDRAVELGGIEIPTELLNQRASQYPKDPPPGGSSASPPPVPPPPAAAPPPAEASAAMATPNVILEGSVLYQLLTLDPDLFRDWAASASFDLWAAAFEFLEQERLFPELVASRVHELTNTNGDVFEILAARSFAVGFHAEDFDLELRPILVSLNQALCRGVDLEELNRMNSIELIFMLFHTVLSNDNESGFDLD